MAIHGSARAIVQDWGTSEGITLCRGLSASLPDSDYDVDDYIRVVANTVRAIKIHRGRGRFRRRVVVGGDLNVTLPGGLDGITRDHVPRGRGSTSQGALASSIKHETWVKCCPEGGLSAWSTEKSNKVPTDTERDGEPGRPHSAPIMLFFGRPSPYRGCRFTTSAGIDLAGVTPT